MSIQFGPFTLDLETRQLLRSGRDVHLTPKAFDLLATLALSRPSAQSKQVLHARLWKDTFVAEANLSNLVGEIRAALDDRDRVATWIRTVHGFGYAFCGEAIAVPARAQPAAAHPECWLAWGHRRFPLSIGEHVIGRDPDVDIPLDESTVSRRHARLLVTIDGAVLEDFESKNGTLRGGEPVTGPVALSDGDALQIGSLILTFHMRPPLGSTDTHARTLR